MFRPTSALTFDNAAAMLEAGLQAIASGQNEIDLAGLTAVDSSAVAVLLAWQRSASEKGVLLHLHQAPSNLQSLMGLYGLNGLLSAQADHAVTVSADS
jgi:phospholipid transport system transporter-binding protein